MNAHSNWCGKFWITFPLAASAVGIVAAQEVRNLHELPSDLCVPGVTQGAPRAGQRVWQSNPGYEDWDVAHALYLPPEWEPARRYPLIVEYPGNGGFTNALGDRCEGRVEDCKLGYGLSGGKGMIWVSLPFVDPKTRRHALQWWGDADATAAYCEQTVAGICQEYGGDPQAVVLTGFSRGAIACNYIGLRNDRIAQLWRAMLPHSHYDGVRSWNYERSDPGSAKTRLARLGECPQLISHELTTADTQRYLQGAMPQGQFTFLPIPFPNHSDQWVLKDLPERATARAWLARVLGAGGRPAGG